MENHICFMGKSTNVEKPFSSSQTVNVYQAGSRSWDLNLLCCWSKSANLACPGTLKLWLEVWLGKTCGRRNQLRMASLHLLMVFKMADPMECSSK